MVNIKEKLNEGWVHSRIIIEVLGKPEDHVDKALHVCADNIKKDKEIMVISEDYSKIDPQESLFSGFVELEILTKTLMKLVWFCYDYLPSSVEIIDPQTIHFKNSEFSNYLNELQIRLHHLGEELKVAKQANRILEANGHNLLRNLVFQCIKDEDRTLSQLSDFTGIGEKDLEPFLNIYIEKGGVVKKEDKYSLVRR